MASWGAFRGFHERLLLTGGENRFIVIGWWSCVCLQVCAGPPRKLLAAQGTGERALEGDWD